MAYKSTSFMFRDLDDAEEADFRAYAREHYEPDKVRREKGAFIPNPQVHHPVLVDECKVMDKEYLEQLKRKQTMPPYGKKVE